MENELNKWIVEVLFEGCWHESFRGGWSEARFDDRCKHCNKFGYELSDNPDYCNDLNLASLAEAKAIEVVGKKAYFEHLCYVTQDATWRPEYEKREVAFCLSLATATALQRCTAVRAAVEGK